VIQELARRFTETALLTGSLFSRQLRMHFFVLVRGWPMLVLTAFRLGLGLGSRRRSPSC